MSSGNPRLRSENCSVLLDACDVEFEGLSYRYVAVSAEPLCVFSERLTDAERDVACRAAAGESAASIARARQVSRRTVENQLAQIYRKLGISCRHELFEELFGPVSQDQDARSQSSPRSGASGSARWQGK